MSIIVRRILVLGLLILAQQASALPGVHGKFLPPNKAFQFHAQAHPGAIQLNWTIAPNYYLYRDRFRIKAKSGAIGSVHFPAATTRNEPGLGKAQVYYHQVALTAPVISGNVVDLSVTYQGCSEAGLCYAPITRNVSLAVPPSANQLSLKATGKIVAGHGRLAQMVEFSNPFVFMAIFFGLGVLLAFTPCVLPMIPILAGIIGGGAGTMSTRRGFLLSLSYVISMALVYTAAGLAAGFLGSGLQAYFQAPWVIGIFAAVFVILALSLLGVYQLRLPTSWVNKMNGISTKQKGGTLLGAVLMGALSALIVSPCIAAPLAGALVVIGKVGDPVRGGLALFALSLGMGAPLLAFGTIAARFLPRSGRWLEYVERTFGVVLLAFAVWLLGRLLPAPALLVLWGICGILLAVFWGVFERLGDNSKPADRVIKGLGIAAFIYALILVIGGSAGASRPLVPLSPFVAKVMPQSKKERDQGYQLVNSLSGLNVALSNARERHRPVMVDFYATWCTSCIEMAHTTLRSPTVTSWLRKFDILRVDVTENTLPQRQLLRFFGFYGPPGFAFYNKYGRRLDNDSVVGYEGPIRFAQHLKNAVEPDGGSGQSSR